jgi:hypothetical protein
MNNDGRLNVVEYCLAFILCRMKVAHEFDNDQVPEDVPAFLRSSIDHIRRCTNNARAGTPFLTELMNESAYLRRGSDLSVQSDADSDWSPSLTAAHGSASTAEEEVVVVTKFLAIGAPQAEALRSSLTDLVELSSSPQSRLEIFRSHDHQESSSLFMLIESHASQTSYVNWQNRFGDLLQELRRFCAKEPKPDFFERL